MSDDATKFIIGDTAISAAEEHPGGKRGFLGRKRRQRQQLTHCENCGTPLTGPYCGQCGQPAIDYRRSFRHVMVDLLDSFLNWDSKFIATIGLLIARPWHLTNEFLAGRRVKYLHPARLYLLASILFFFAVTYWAKSIHIDAPGDLPPEVKAQVEEDLKKENFTPEQLAEVEQLLNVTKLSPEAKTRIEESLKKNLTPEQRAKVENALKVTKISPAKAARMAKKIKEKEAKVKAGATPASSSVPESSPREKSEADTEKETESNYDGPFLRFDNKPDKPKNDFEKWIEARAKDKIGEHGTKAQLFLVTVISNLPYMMLCCIPLFAFVLKILYIRKHIFYIDHLVYALHIHTFVYLAVMLIVATTVGLNRLIPSFAGWFIGLLWTAFAVQNFLSIRRVYKQGWFFSIFKFFAGGFVYLIVLFVALAATFFITLALP